MPQILFDAKDINKKTCAGMIYPYPTYSLDGDDITVTAGTAFLLATTRPYQWKRFSVAEATFTLSAGPTFIYAKTDDGVTAEYAASQSTSFVTLRSNGALFSILKDGTGIQVDDLTDACEMAVPDLLIMAQFRPNAIFFLNNKETVLTSPGTDDVIVELLDAFRGAKRLVVDAFDSGTDDMYYYESSTLPPTFATWTKITPTTATFSRTQYQGPTGFTALNPNAYAVNYIWKTLWDTPENPNECFITLATQSYGSAAAASLDVPISSGLQLPIELALNSVLVGRIIAKNDGGAEAPVVQGRDYYPIHF